ncbi:PIG-L family deacetylase [Embleya sp. NPDC020630]|uniref:PIG-L family deacetylase n=1 Tax=Embleya sp. NPDC020630 TaxID=3363979 RepID=UPI0037B571E4
MELLDRGDGSAPSRAVARPASAPVVSSTTRVLNVVAHHDDDLLFLSPELLDNLTAGAFLRSVYFNASDYQGYPKYMTDREQGLRDAYARTLGAELRDWKSQPYESGGVRATLWTLGERVSILETRIPDGYMRTPLGAKRLWGLYADNTRVTTRPGDTFPAQDLDRDRLVAFLRGLRDEFKPDRVNTLDPTSDLQGDPDPVGGFHQDHVAVSRLVKYALEQDTKPCSVTYHRDYTIEREPVNLTGEQAARKKKAFGVYTDYDPDAKRSKVYGPWLRKSYEVDAAWRRDLVLPMPVPDRVEPVAAHPYLGPHYRIRNRGNGLELSARPEPDAPVTTTAARDQPGSAFRLAGIRYGWGLIPVGGEVIVAVPGASTAAECGARLVARALDPAQAVRAHGDVATGFSLIFAHSGMALTGAHAPGGDVFQAPLGSGDVQKWDFIKV